MWACCGVTMPAWCWRRRTATTAYRRVVSGVPRDDRGRGASVDRPPARRWRPESRGASPAACPDRVRSLRRLPPACSCRPRHSRNRLPSGVDGDAEQVAVAGRRLGLIGVDPLRDHLLAGEPGSISTTWPFLPLHDQMWPFGAIARASGRCSRPSLVTSRPVPALLGARRRVSDGDDAVLHRVGHIERVVRSQREAGRADQEHVLVGALGEAAGDHGLARDDRRSAGRDATIGCRSTVALFTTTGMPVAGSRLAGPERSKPAMLTNSVAVDAVVDHRHVAPRAVDVGPDQTAASLPLASNTSRQPSPLVAVVPSVLGVLPTMTQPLLSMVIAVVRPTPPGHCGSCCGSSANNEVVWVAGLIVDDRSCPCPAGSTNC